MSRILSRSLKAPVSLLAAIVFCYSHSAHGELTETTATLLRSYEQKLTLLQSWHVEFEDQTEQYADPEQYGDKYTSSVTFVRNLGKGLSEAMVTYALEASSLEARSISAPQLLEEKVFHDKLRRRLVYLSPDDAQGFITEPDAQERMHFGISSPLVWMGLYPQHWDQTVEYVPGAQNLDFSILFQDPRYHLAPETELVDGHDCVVVQGPAEGVVDNPVQRWWLARDLGYAMVRYEEMSDHPKLGRFTRILTTTSEMEEHAPGLFLPRRLITEHFQVITDPEGNPVREPLIRHEYTVTKVELNPVLDDACFQLVFPPGTLVRDDTKGIEYLVGVEPRHLDGILSSAAQDASLRLAAQQAEEGGDTLPVRNADGFSPNVPAAAAGHSSLLRPVFTAAVVALLTSIVLLGGRVLFRRAKQR
ncbi:MAG: hypothetical protein JXA57_16390 [Armatimonadetes bacterium]|nr:hypothetical protein [Armatimonadota bacterium]